MQEESASAAEGAIVLNRGAQVLGISSGYAVWDRLVVERTGE